MFLERHVIIAMVKDVPLAYVYRKTMEKQSDV